MGRFREGPPCEGLGRRLARDGGVVGFPQGSDGLPFPQMHLT